MRFCRCFNIRHDSTSDTFLLQPENVVCRGLTVVISMTIEIRALDVIPLKLVRKMINGIGTETNIECEVY